MVVPRPLCGVALCMMSDVANTQLRRQILECVLRLLSSPSHSNCQFAGFDPSVHVNADVKVRGFGPFNSDPASTDSGPATVTIHSLWNKLCESM